MHTFQPMTADMMEFDPFTKIGSTKMNSFLSAFYLKNTVMH